MSDQLTMKEILRNTASDGCAAEPQAADQTPVVQVPQGEPSVFSIISQHASNPNFDVEKLKSLIELKERMDEREAEKAYSAAMSECQKEMPVVVRDATNNETGKGYARIEAIQTVAKPIYSRHGFSLSFTDEKADKEGQYHVACECRHRQGHAMKHTLYNVPIDMTGPKGGANKTAIQGMVSSLSYARRVLLCMVFNITVADQDDDGQGTSLLTGDQIAEVNTLLENSTLSLKGILKWLGAESLDRVKASDFVKLTTELKRKQKPTEQPDPALVALLQAWQGKLDAQPSIDDVNKKFLPEIKKIEPKESRVAVFNLIKERFAPLGFVFDDTAKKFVIEGANP